MDQLIAATKDGIRFVHLASYPDGMPLVHWDGAPIERLLLRPASLGAFFAAMFFVDALAGRGLPVPHLILPSMPGARQDRFNATGDYLFTAKSVARAINARNFPSVTMLDPHSEVTPALVHRSRIVHAADCINPPAGKYVAVVSPDAGAEKRAGAVARKLGVPLIHAWKNRDVTTGAICDFGMQKMLIPHGSLFLVVDDICDGGGTFTGLGDVIAYEGFKAHLWVTHGIFSKGTTELLKRFGHLYCTDSVEGPRDGVIEINVCEKLLENTL